MRSNQFHLTGDVSLDDLAVYMKERNYVWNVVGPTGVHDSGLFGTGLGGWSKTLSPMFIVFGRPGEPAIIATKGCVLGMDGDRIIVEALIAEEENHEDHA